MKNLINNEFHMEMYFQARTFHAFKNSHSLLTWKTVSVICSHVVCPIQTAHILSCLQENSEMHFHFSIL